MKINNTDFSKKLIDIFKEYGFNIDQSMAKRFEIYKNMLLEWNEKINLTAITDEDEIIVKHFIDCMHCTRYIGMGDSIVDIGTGAGFPGIVLAIFFNGNINITLVDSLNKRLIFLQEVIDALQIKNVNIVHSRAEDLAHKLEYREKFDIVTARAVSSLNVLLEYTTGYLKIGGKCVYMKGDNLDEEIKISKNALNILNCKIHNINEYKLKVNNEEYIRTILEVKKVSNTPNNYPRTFGNIKKKQL